jgi:AbrB family looped-hinge helix DNA binding protein
METTKLSSKGQVVLPSATRARKKWRPGTELEVVETAEGVLLKPISPFPPTSLDDVIGSANYRGPRRSLAEMDAAVLREAKRHK